MTLQRRMYQSEDDYWRLRAFLREVFLLNHRRELSWQVARLDYWRFFGNENIEYYSLNETIVLWEAPDGQIASFITPESRGYVYLQVNPNWRSPELEHAMMAAAEEHLAEVKSDGKRHLVLWAHQTDDLRIKVLEQRGYRRSDWPEQQFGRTLDIPIPDAPPAEGYTIRSLGDQSELPARSWLSWRVFHPDEPDEKYEGWDWYHSIQKCPMYRRDLDLVAVAPDGELAAFTTVWYDDVTRTGYFEPVGTSPDHQRKGLSKAILNEGLRRLKVLGAIHATVAGYSEAAVALYGSVMLSEPMQYERWHKAW